MADDCSDDEDGQDFTRNPDVPGPDKVKVRSRYLPYMAIDDLTPDYLKKMYLPGIKLIGGDNQEMSPEWFVQQIENGISKIEQYTNVDILERFNQSELHDYSVNDYLRYGFLQLYRIPSRSVEEVRAVYPTGQTIQVFPKEWIRLAKAHSQVNLVPTAGTLQQVIIGQGSDFIPLIFAKLSFLPQLWEVDYTSGFDPDQIPKMVVEAICKMAVVEMLTTMSDTIYPVGIGSQSLSIDGMSQSRSIMQPAFKARIDAYKNDLGLPGTQAEKTGLIKQIRNNYLGVNLASL